MRTVLLVLAIVCALIAAALDFGWITTDEPHVVAWLGLSLVFGWASFLPQVPN